MKKMTVAALGSALVLAFAAPAFAHVTANPNEGPAADFFRTAFRVGHGCGDSPTHTVKVKIPAGVVSVAPEQIPGWEVATKEGKLDEPVVLHGEEITEGVTEITWKATGEPLNSHNFLEFGVSMRLPEEIPGGADALYFPFVQNCDEGNLRWVNIPASLSEWGDTEDPAPFVRLGAAGGGHGDSEEAEGEHSGGVEASAVSLSDDEKQAIADVVLASADLESDDFDSGVVLGGLGLGLGAIALIVAMMAFRKRTSA